MFDSRSVRPFDIIALAEQAWQASDPLRAEKLFEQGISAYKQEEPDGLDYALGRYGAFLLAQGRLDEAAHVLKQAVERKTDIPAIWSDYIRIILARHDFDALKRCVEHMAKAAKYRIEPEFVLTYARRAEREGAPDFAEQVMRWMIERCAREGDKEGRWAAIGDLGRIVERAGHQDRAVKIWRDAFEDGSSDPDTASRLSMHLERTKDYKGAAQVIREALTRHLPASAEESLRKRLARCEEKTANRGPSKSRRPADVAAYSIRRQTTLFESMFQIRLKSPVLDLGILNNAVRCLLALKGSTTLIDFDLTRGTEIRCVENLPLFRSMLFAADGRGIGVLRTAAVGRGPTILRFLDSEGHLAAESSVPDATSEIALGQDLWYVGCRNGFLYAFGFDGRQRWAWETPGASKYTDNPYFRPCPYFVASHRSFAVVASMGNIYAVTPDGKTLWHSALPSEHQTEWKFTSPFAGLQENLPPYTVLGLPPGAPREQVKSAYRRLALATHPDRNPNDTEATANFRRIQEAYEHILAGHTGSGITPAEITLTLGIQGGGPLASFVAANAASVVVGSSEGRMYVFEEDGRLREARVLGDGSIRVALRPDGTVGAAWCSNALLFFVQNNIINAAESVEWPSALTMLRNDVVLWRGNNVQVMNTIGQLIFSLEFSKTVTSAVAHGDTLFCAAGVLTAFRRCDTAK